MKVLFVTSEAIPFVSTGGLGDVSGSLPAALNRTGKADVRVVLPLYRSVKEKYRDRLTTVYTGTVSLTWRRQYLGVLTCEYGGVRYYFIDNEYYFGRVSVYGEYDDGERFAFFGRAVCEMIEHVGFLPDLLHSNDWQSALSVVYLKKQYPALCGVRCVFSVHNIEYQGKYDPGIAGDVFGLSDDQKRDLLHDGDLNLMKGAIVACDALLTVSPRYASEMRDPFFAYGLEGEIAKKTPPVTGIINGIDTGKYDPSAARGAAFPYSASNLSLKAKNRTELCGAFGLDGRKDVPVLAMVTRLAPHKGIDLVVRVIDELLDAGAVRFVLLGTGRGDYESFFSDLATRRGGEVGVKIGYDRELATLVYAGSDMFLMPSQTEPCGISQMIAQRYGTPPIVRETGGLADTVVPYNEYTGEGTGFSFCNYNAHEMKKTVEYAASVFARKKEWRALMKRCMAADVSWDRSAEEYIGVYGRTVRGG